MRLWPYLKLGDVEIANSLRTLTYLRRGLAGSRFDAFLCSGESFSDTGYVDLYCMAPRHRILTADLRWVPCGDLAEGDEILAFEEHPRPGKRLRRWQRGHVTRSERAVKECVQVTLSNGDRIECSADHPWLVTRGSNRMRWVKASQLRSTDQPQRVSDTWEPDTSHAGGWLAGMYDGEGHLTVTTPDSSSPTIRLGISQVPGPVFDRVIELLELRKFNFTVMQPNLESSAACANLRGGQSEVMRALGTLRPIRLLNNFAKSEIYNRTVRAPDGPPIRISSVEWLGEREVQSIATSTGTYVGEGYLMHNSDIYRGDPFDTRDLRCYCAAVDTGPYKDPAYDNAPWYDITRPESMDFLGLYVEVRIRSVLSRTLTARSNGGGDIGPGRATPRIIEVVGQMMAASPTGMAYGERWLSRALMGSVIGCGNDTLTVLPACPADGSAGALRDLAHVGLVDSPVFTSVVNAESQLQEVAFQLAAGEPYLRKVAIAEVGVDLAMAPSTCVELDGRPPVLVEEAAVIRITAGATILDGVLIEARAGTCPQVGPASVTYEVVNLPAFHTLTIDASTRTVQATNTAGTVVSGLQFLDFDGLFTWLLAASGQRLCVCVDTAGATGLTGATLDIDTVEHEA